MQSSSTSNSNASSFCFRSSYLNVLSCYCSIYLLLTITIAKGSKFNPLIRLPTNDLHRNISRTVVLSIIDFGATGDGYTDDTESLQNVWEAACSSSSRAKIVIPSGKIYLVRPTSLVGPCLSKVILQVSGMIAAPRDPAVWEGLDVHKWLYFHEVKRLKVEGGGIIDGQGNKWWERSCKKKCIPLLSSRYLGTDAILNPCTHAPTALTFHRCQNLKVKNITFFNSQQMHLAFTQCSRVAASAINIIAPADSPNTHGIHISASKDVKLEDIAVRTGDDCISIVSNSSRIQLKNILCSAGHGISIGSLGKKNSYAWVQDVVVDGAVLFNTENGVRIKTCQGGSGFARKIKFVNIWMNNVSNPIIIDQYDCDSPVTCTNQTSAVKIESVTFHSISGTSATEDAIILACSDSYPCKRLYLKDIQLTTSLGTAKSFCWEAYGTSSGLVYPTSCISSGDMIIRHLVKSNSTTSRAYDYALF